MPVLSHGEGSPGKRTPEYRAWVKLRSRCLSPSDPSFHNYGGRGIKVCERWNDYSNFLADMGRKPSPRLSIDRINNDGDYEPSNCRWAPSSVQNSNTRRTTIFVDYNGRRMPLVEAVGRSGSPNPVSLVRSRVVENNWSLRDALTIPHTGLSPDGRKHTYPKKRKAAGVMTFSLIDDEPGQLLRDLDRVVTDLQFIDPARLYGDGVIIDGALIALKIIQQRIDGVKAQQAAE